MIDKSKLSKDWVIIASKNNNNADKILTDRVIHALLLVEGLAKQNLVFIFKGGTSLMLLFNKAKRLSIDIDIVLPEHQQNINNIFNDLIKEQGFIRYELQERAKHTSIDKEHYKFFYNPLFKSATEENYILLDILFEENKYSTINKVLVRSDFIPESGEPIEVNIPSVEDLLADKLTAFAPNTTGIPYFKNEISMSMEIIKQLYDIGNLFDEANNINIIKSTFKAITKTELSYRKFANLTNIDVLEDIYQTSLCLALQGTEGQGDFESLTSGIKRIKQFIFSENYYIDKAILSASKATYLSSLIKYNETNIERYSESSQMTNWVIKEPLNTKLNKLKKSNPEAFFYWYKIYEQETKR